MRDRPIRSGDEPIHARSPLRLRLVLAVVGVAWGVGGVIVFWIAGVVVLAALFGLAAVIAAVNVAVVVGHLRAGPHYQPGPSIPPYRPVDPPSPPRRTPVRVTSQNRLHRYLALMSLCLVLLVLAWSWVRLFSTGLAVAMTLVAMVIPPIAAIVGNAGALEGHGPDQQDDAERPPMDGPGG